MPTNGKTADEIRAEFYEELRRDRAEREAESRRFREDMRKSREEWEARMNREHAEWKAQKEERDREWNRITGEWGRFNNDEGGMVEREGVAALEKLTEIGGMPIEVILPAGAIATKKGREYDGFIVCPDAIVLVEFKRRLTGKHVRKFVDEQLPQFLLDLVSLINGKRVYGAVAGVMVDDDAKALAAENGLFAIRLPANRDVEMLNNTASPRGNGRAVGS